MLSKTSSAGKSKSSGMPVLLRDTSSTLSRERNAQENIESYISVDYPNPNEYTALRVNGDSMNAARIDDGDIIIIRKQDIVENGEIAVVIVNGDDATVKRYHRDGNIVTLTPQSYNPEHTVQIYSLKDVPIRIFGKVVEVRRSFE